MFLLIDWLLYNELTIYSMIIIRNLDIRMKY